MIIKHWNSCSKQGSLAVNEQLDVRIAYSKRSSVRKRLLVCCLFWDSKTFPSIGIANPLGHSTDATWFRLPWGSLRLQAWYNQYRWWCNGQVLMRFKWSPGHQYYTIQNWWTFNGCQQHITYQLMIKCCSWDSDSNFSMTRAPWTSQQTGGWLQVLPTLFGPLAFASCNFSFQMHCCNVFPWREPSLTLALASN